MLIVDHTIGDALVCDAASSVAVVTVFELRVYATANVFELFVQTLANDPNSGLRTRYVAAWSIKSMRIACLSSQLLVIRFH
ncbi:hypothetical protein TNCV_3435021 [Trichonephila clavipes]|nr:hypothetical protein TNCV_3435021 [Trichonephila clavipes]